MADLMLSPSPIDLTYHVENPNRQDCMAVMTTIAKELGHPTSCFVEFDEWAKLLSHKTSTDCDSGTSVLMDFLVKDFRHMSGGGIVLDTSKARQVSAILRNVDGVSVETIATYVKAWKKFGMFL